MMTRVAPGALRFIDPNWDEASPDGRLYPFYFYWFIDERHDDEDSTNNPTLDDDAQVNPE